MTANPAKNNQDPMPCAPDPEDGELNFERSDAKCLKK